MQMQVNESLHNANCNMNMAKHNVNSINPLTVMTVYADRIVQQSEQSLLID